MHHDDDIKRSDVTGEPVTVGYDVGISYDNNVHILTLDYEKIDEELSSLTLAEAIDRAHRVEKRSHVNEPLNTELHTKVRLWAQKEGRNVGRRGLVSYDLLTDYVKAHGNVDDDYRSTLR